MRIIFIIILVVVVGGFGYAFFGPKGEDVTTSREGVIEREGQLRSVDFSKLSSEFRFSAKIPAEFEVEYIPGVRAVNVYDPRLPGADVREKSQIYISSFEANRFLTLGTVEITQQDETLVHGHDAVLYEIAKKPGMPDFTQQPSWRNRKHKAVDIRFTNMSPSLFYPFARNPNLPEGVFNDFIDSLVFYNDKESFQAPLERFRDRVVKKPFGMYITPQNSPVQPEFFSGYHTGVDYEIFSGEETTEVPVFAMCGGELTVARTASGYGGVAVQECLFDDIPVTVVYGHLLRSSLAQPDSYLSPEDIIGSLAPAGQGAGGGRKHLHLGVHKGSELDIRGYVATKEELPGWFDPAPLFDFSFRVE